VNIDSHHHLWRYTPDEYAWLDDSMKLLRRDFLPGDLLPELRKAGIDGVVTVQARQSLQESTWLLDFAEKTPWMLGVVGWADLRSPEFPQQLSALAGRPKLKGLRHVVQGESDPDFLLGEAFNRGIRALRPHALTYDLLILEHQLPQAIRFVDLHPDQVFVLDHLAKPAARNFALEPWRARIQELARRPQVSCKLSGLVTEAQWTNWTVGQLRPYLETVLEAFGPHRLMFGSDWPVCLVASSYQRWHALVEEWIAPLSRDERNAIMGNTARKAYRL
jgi:L-fuconolactonase